MMDAVLNPCDTEKHIAEKPIKTYMLFNRKEKKLTPSTHGAYNLSVFFIGQTYEAPMSNVRVLFFDKVRCRPVELGLYGGFHSFSKEIGMHLVGGVSALIECEIPVGATYYYSSRMRTYISNKIHLSRIEVDVEVEATFNLVFNVETLRRFGYKARPGIPCEYDSFPYVKYF